MPGIAGIIGPGEPRARAETLSGMLNAMMHEPGYVKHIAAGEACGVWAGIAGPPACSDFQCNSAGDICILLHAPRNRQSADARCARDAGRMVAEVLRSYEVRGPGCISELNGWFSGLLLDRREHRLVLFNDRYGLGRLYLHTAIDGTLYFASEAKCILRVAPSTRHLDPQSLAEQVSCAAVLQGRSLFRGLTLLPPASLWTYENGQWRRGTHFDARQWERQSALGAEEFQEQLRAVFSRAVRRQLHGEDLAAMSLTGGLDGRMIMAWAGAKPDTLPCYTFAGPVRESADVRIAREIAKICGQPHHCIAVGEDFMQQFPLLAEEAVYISDGTMDVTGAVELYVNRAARSIAPVRLTGSFGSEIVRGNVAFKPQPIAADLLQPDFAPLVQEAERTYCDERMGHALSFIAFKQIPWYHHARFSLEISQIDLRLPYLDNDLVSHMYRAPPPCRATDGPSWRLIAQGNAALAEVPTDRGQGLAPGNPIALLRRLHAELLFKAEYAYDLGMPQPLARVDHLLRPLRLERLFLGRHKFYHFRTWYRDRLRHYLHSMLLDDAASAGEPWFRASTARRMVQQHIEGQRNYTAELHLLLTVALVRRTLLAAPLD